MKADSQVSIVIPNYNGMAFMEACMQAVLRDAPKAELIVVDNASKDGSLEYTREHFPEARVLALDQNYGFARAVNEGIRAATRPYVILLNNDTEVEPGFTDALVGALEADVRAFSAQAKLIQLQDPLKLDDAGNFYCALGWAFARGKDRPSADYEEQDEVFAACAGAAVYRKALFEKSGILTKLISPIWRISTSAGERVSSDTGISTYQRPGYCTPEAEPAVPVIMNLR